jgi:hypothetical protein
VYWPEVFARLFFLHRVDESDRIPQAELARMRELTLGLMSWPTRVRAEDWSRDLTISGGRYAELLAALSRCLDELERLYLLAEPRDEAD